MSVAFSRPPLVQTRAMASPNDGSAMSEEEVEQFQDLLEKARAQGTLAHVIAYENFRHGACG